MTKYCNFLAKKYNLCQKNGNIVQLSALKARIVAVKITVPKKKKMFCHKITNFAKYFQFYVRNCEFL